MKQKTQKYLGFLLAGGVLVGGIASATFDFSGLPNSEKIKTGETIYAADIMSFSNGLEFVDIRTNGHDPSGDFDLVGKKSDD